MKIINIIRIIFKGQLNLYFQLMNELKEARKQKNNCLKVGRYSDASDFHEKERKLLIKIDSVSQSHSNRTENEKKDIKNEIKSVKPGNGKTKKSKKSNPNNVNKKVNKRAKLLGFDENIKVIEKKVIVWTGEYDSASNSYVDLEQYRLEVRYMVGNQIIGAFDFIDSFSEDIAIIRKDEREGQFELSKYGYIHKTGKIIAHATYDECFRFKNNFAIVGKHEKHETNYSTTIEKKYGLINKNGIRVIPLIYSLDIAFFEEKVNSLNSKDTNE